MSENEGATAPEETTEENVETIDSEESSDVDADADELLDVDKDLSIDEEEKGDDYNDTDEDELNDLLNSVTEEDLDNATDEELDELADKLGVDFDAPEVDDILHEHSDDYEEMEIAESDDDDDIILNMYDDKGYSGWMKSAEEMTGEEVNKDFALLVAKEHIHPKFLLDRGIYSVRDLIAHTGELEERTSDDAVYVPPKDSKEYEVFLRDHMGLPSSEEEYDTSLIEEVFDGNEDTVDFLKSWGIKSKFTQTQLEDIARQFKAEQEAHEAFKQEELENYKKENVGRLQEIYGNDYGQVVKDVKGFLNMYGKDFLNEFRGEKALNSKSFFDMILTVLDKGSEIGNTRFVDGKRLFTGMSNDKLKQIEYDMLDHKWFDSKFATHSDDRVRKAHKKLRNRFDMVSRALEQRGIN